MNEEQLMYEVYTEVKDRVHKNTRYNIDENIKYQDTIYKLLNNIKKEKKILPYMSPHREKSISEIVNFISKHIEKKKTTHSPYETVNSTPVHPINKTQKIVEQFSSHKIIPKIKRAICRLNIVWNGREDNKKFFLEDESPSGRIIDNYDIKLQTPITSNTDLILTLESFSIYNFKGYISSTSIKSLEEFDSFVIMINDRAEALDEIRSIQHSIYTNAPTTTLTNGKSIDERTSIIIPNENYCCNDSSGDAEPQTQFITKPKSNFIGLIQSPKEPIQNFKISLYGSYTDSILGVQYIPLYPTSFKSRCTIILMIDTI